MATILLTGAARGLGHFTARRLAQLGHHLILTARTEADAARTAATLRAHAPQATVDVRALDLGSLAAVRRFGEGLAAEGVALDVLFHCAGVMQTNPARQLTADGLEQTLAVNVLAPFLLTATLWPALRRATRARVITAGSRMHLPGGRGAPVDFDFADPFLERGYHPDRAYKNSKLALLWFTFELQRRAASLPVTVASVCPGFVPATAAESARGLLRPFLKYVLVHAPFARTVDEAVDSFVFMATDPAVEGHGGTFWGERQVIASSPESLEVDKAARFWAFCAEKTHAPAWL